MADPTGKVKPGDGLNRLFQAATFNLTMDTVNDYLRRMRGRTGAAGNAPDPIVPATLIYVKNATGSTLLPYSVVTPSGTPIYDPADEPVGQQQQPLIEVIAPASASDVVLITQEEIADGEIGLAASAGVCVAAVAVSTGTHKFAAPTAGVTTSLASGTSGPVRILEPWSSGTGERLVLIGSQEASAGGSITVKEVDGSPSVSSVTELRFDQADGFVVSTPGAGIARVDAAAATITQAGIVSTVTQRWAGDKTVDDGYNIGISSSTSGSTYCVMGTWTIPGGGTCFGINNSNGAGVLFDNNPTPARLIAWAAFGSTARYSVHDSGAVVDGVSGSFTTADSKTVTVTGGIITSIV